MKNKINEGLFGSVKKFSDAFFDGLAKNTSNRIIDKAKNAGVPQELIDVMEKIQKDKEQLDTILNKIAKK